MYFLSNMEECKICRIVHRMIKIGSRRDECFERLNVPEHEECPTGLVLKGYSYFNIDVKKSNEYFGKAFTVYGNKDGMYYQQVIHAAIAVSRNDPVFSNTTFETMKKYAENGKWHWTPLAMCYWSGIGCAQDREKAIKMLIHSGNAGNSASLIQAAGYLDSVGRVNEALPLYQRVADNGYVFMEVYARGLQNKHKARIMTLSPCNCTVSYIYISTPFTECPICEKRVGREIECLD
jgi:TPR repeat protein